MLHSVNKYFSDFSHRRDCAIGYTCPLYVNVRLWLRSLLAVITRYSRNFSQYVKGTHSFEAFKLEMFKINRISWVVEVDECSYGLLWGRHKIRIVAQRLRTTEYGLRTTSYRLQTTKLQSECNTQARLWKRECIPWTENTEMGTECGWGITSIHILIEDVYTDWWSFLVD